MKRIIAPLLVILLVCSCTFASPKNSNRIADQEATVREGPEHTWEIAVKYSFLGYSEPSNLAQTPKKLYASYWIYLPALEGNWTADKIIVSSQKGHLKFPYLVSDLKGTVGFDHDQLILDLLIPNRPNGKEIIGYLPFTGNATYFLQKDRTNR